VGSVGPGGDGYIRCREAGVEDAAWNYVTGLDFFDLHHCFFVHSLSLCPTFFACFFLIFFMCIWFRR
jgi:hypothetical protein